MPAWCPKKMVAPTGFDRDYTLTAERILQAA
jgi:hypothetical protein